MYPISLKYTFKQKTINFELSMGVGAQKYLGGHQTFAQKMTLNFPRKASRFFCPN